MPNTREKLTELVRKAEQAFWIDRFDIDHSGFVAGHLIANGVTVQEWISVKDRLPQSHETVLCFTKGFGQWVATWDDCGDEMWSDGEYWSSKFGVTHWMPLPQPPKGE